MAIPRIQPRDLHELIEKETKEASKVHLIDVREPHEVSEISIPLAVNYPLSKLDVYAILEELGVGMHSSNPLYFICRSGARSENAARLFKSAGYSSVFNVDGGVLRWLGEGLPTTSD